jgi:hypothetical protein
MRTTRVRTPSYRPTLRHGHAEARGLIGEVVVIGVRGDARHGKGNDGHRRAEPEEEPEAASVGCGNGCVEPRHVDPYALVGR